MSMAPYVAAAVGFVTAAVLAMINSWLTGRENVAEGVRNQRIAAYPAVWNRTGVVSRWPRTNAGREQFLRLHEDLRHWYFVGGGLYLSTRARKRYEHLQLVLQAVLSMNETKAAENYESVMQAASYFRTGLTDDLETRERRSVVIALARRRADRLAGREADTRLESARAVAKEDATLTGDASPGPPIHIVAPKDEELTIDKPASTE
jgi:hypothetical protein